MVGISGNIAATCVNFGNTFLGTKTLANVATLTKRLCFSRLPILRRVRTSGSNIVGAVFGGT